MPRQLVLVKHSLPAIDPTRPPSRWDLTDEGRARAAWLAERLLPLTPAIISSSPEPKTQETARILAERLGVSLETVDDLREQDRDNEPVSNPDDFRAGVKRLFEDPGRVVFGTESADRARFRFMRAVTDVLQRHQRGNVVLVSHGTVITLFVAACTGIEPYPFWRRLGLPSFVTLTVPDLSLRHVEWAVPDPGSRP